MNFRALTRRTAAGWLVTLGMAAAALETVPGFALIPAGEFEMGDHHGFVDPKHGGDETPIHTVRLDAFQMGIHERHHEAVLRVSQWGLDQPRDPRCVRAVSSGRQRDLLCETRAMSPYSRIGWDGARFASPRRQRTTRSSASRWPGAALYPATGSAPSAGLPVCYGPATWACAFNKVASGSRPRRSGSMRHAADRRLPTGTSVGRRRRSAEGQLAGVGEPVQFGPLPWTTPVGFFDGSLRGKADWGWPGPQESYQTANGANGFGLYDMSGNVWQFVNDWYGRDYYAYSPSENPPGPASGSVMPDGKPYRGMRGGNWYNGENGHGRVSNRNPSYFRGPQDPDHPYYHLGFRVVLPVAAESRPATTLTPLRNVERGAGTPPDGRAPRASERPGGGRRGDGRRPAPPSSERPPAREGNR